MSDTELALSGHEADGPLTCCIVVMDLLEFTDQTLNALVAPKADRAQVIDILRAAISA